MKRPVCRFGAVWIVAIGLVSPLATVAGQSAPRFPLPPPILPESTEVRLALSAAPSEITRDADVYLLRADGAKRVKTGSNGVACMVGRDSHEGSLYPICFDKEGVETVMAKEVMEGQLRMQGKSEDEIKKTVEAAYASGRLRIPTRPTIAYMMSPDQVLFSSPDAKGVRVGPWHPHVMIGMANTRPADFGLPDDAKNGIIELSSELAHIPQMIVQVARWSNGIPDKLAPPKTRE